MDSADVVDKRAKKNQYVDDIKNTGILLHHLHVVSVEVMSNSGFSNEVR